MSTPTPDWWQKFSPYLDQALGMTDQERAEWLESLREQEPAVASELEKLLQEHRELVQERFLERTPLSASVDPMLAGQTLGPYTLISQISEGGMGSVWLAARSDGRFERQAAVKFLRGTFFGRGGAERFKREGAILARLAHPHVAQLLDAGVSPTGQPYLILEHVEGENIVEYCDHRRVEVEARLRLFLDVLAAVAHAHANLIVHRDIKPSNVLVRVDGEVKLVDFGIAKLLEEEGGAAAATQLTREGGGALTPQYAAPEQITGSSVTTATDVYACGVLLYELLTGQHPAGPGRHSTADLVKAIVETDPPRASQAAAPTGIGSKAAIAANRGTTPEKLRRILRGDLDTIVAKALKKNPEGRYASATAMADDLRRYLGHEPVSARPDTFAYRSVKFLRRYWLPVSAVTLVIASLLAGLYVANRERVIAEQRFGQLRQLSDRVFALDRRIQTLPGSAEARQSLVTASLQYLEGLRADAQGDLDLTEEIASGYERVARIQGVPAGLNLGQLDKAEESLKKADALLGAVLKARPRSRRALHTSAIVLSELALVTQVQHRDQDALAYADKAVQHLGAFLQSGTATNSERKEIANWYGNLAIAYKNLHQYEKSVFYARQDLDLLRTLPSDSDDVGAALGFLASTQRSQGNLEAALQTIQEARRTFERSSGNNETEDWFTYYGILWRQGMILGEDGGISLGRPGEAIEPLRKALEIAQEAARKNPHDYASRSRSAAAARDLGNILRHRNPRQALRVYDLGIRWLSEAAPSVATGRDRAHLLASSSYALESLRRSSEAKQRIDAAVGVLKNIKEYPSDHIRLNSSASVVLEALADYYADQEHPQSAVTIYEELTDKIMASKPDPQNDLSDANELSRLYQKLENLYRRTGETAKADALQARRKELWRQWDGKLPKNTFIQRQLASATLPSGSALRLVALPAPTR